MSSAPPKAPPPVLAPTSVSSSSTRNIPPPLPPPDFPEEDEDARLRLQLARLEQEQKEIQEKLRLRELEKSQMVVPDSPPEPRFSAAEKGKGRDTGAPRGEDFQSRSRSPSRTGERSRDSSLFGDGEHVRVRISLIPRDAREYEVRRFLASMAIPMYVLFWYDYILLTGY